MRPSPGVDFGLDVTVRLVYVLFVLAMLWTVFPGARGVLRTWWQQQIWAYRVGRWAQDFERRPGWQREALEVRGDPRARKVEAHGSRP